MMPAGVSFYTKICGYKLGVLAATDYLDHVERLFASTASPGCITSQIVLEAILKESERAARIVRNLLTFARKRHTTRAMIDVNEVVRQTLALRSYEQRVTNISVIDALAAGLPTVTNT